MVGPMPARAALWDRTFTIPFRQFRAELARIAALSHAAVEGAVVAASWDEIPIGSLVLPVDDDDWFAPHAASTVRRLMRPDVSVCVWRKVWIEVPLSVGHAWHMVKRRLGLRPPEIFTCTTNNYALIKSSEDQTLHQQHVKASRWVDRLLTQQAHEVLVVDLGLSVANRSLASQTTLRRYDEDSDLSRKLLLAKFYAYQRLYRHPPRGDLSWSAPYVAMMSELMRQLRVVRRRI